MMLKGRKQDEPISGILEKAPAVHQAFGGFFGFLLMAMAILATKRRWPLILAITTISGTAKLAGWI